MPGVPLVLVSIFKGRHIYEDVMATAVTESKTSSEQRRKLEGTDFYTAVKVAADT